MKLSIKRNVSLQQSTCALIKHVVKVFIGHEIIFYPCTHHVTMFIGRQF